MSLDGFDKLSAFLFSGKASFLNRETHDGHSDNSLEINSLQDYAQIKLVWKRGKVVVMFAGENIFGMTWWMKPWSTLLESSTVMPGQILKEVSKEIKFEKVTFLTEWKLSENIECSVANRQVNTRKTKLRSSVTKISNFGIIFMPSMKLNVKIQFNSILNGVH